jgi:GNAT superfamily N-acetyltransferase
MTDLAVDIRPGGPADAEHVALVVAAGLETYRGFAPAGWEPPVLEWELDVIRERLGLADTWSRIAVADGAPVGHVALVSARANRHPGSPVIPGLAHLWHLFVVPDWWGTGLATELLRAALAEAEHRAYDTIRLFTPAEQARARAFYEREGFRTAGDPQYEPGLGLTLVEYRRELDAGLLAPR